MQARESKVQRVETVTCLFSLKNGHFITAAPFLNIPKWKEKYISECLS